MDREMELRHLNEAKRHVADGARVVARQQLIVWKLGGDGQDTTEARRLLNNFRLSQEQFIVHRSLILKALEE